MKKRKLMETGEQYQSVKKQMEMLSAANGGTDDLVRWGLLSKQGAESDKEFKLRKKLATGYNYTSRMGGKLSGMVHRNNTSYSAFSTNSELDISPIVKKCGSRGKSLVSLSQSVTKNVLLFGYSALWGMRSGDNLKFKEIQPLDILDFSYGMDEFGEYSFRMVKFKVDDFIALYENEITTAYDVSGREPVEVFSEYGKIIFQVFDFDGESPFKSKSRLLEVAKLDMSIITNISLVSQMLEIAAFPILMKPRLDSDETDNEIIGMNNVLDFDAELPNSKPEWLDTRVKDPVTTISEWTDRTIDEIYSNVNASCLRRGGSSDISGEALKIQFSELNDFIADISKSITKKVESWVLLSYCADTLFRDVSSITINVDRSDDFRVDSIASDLVTFSSVLGMVDSPKFKADIQKTIAARVLQNTPKETTTEINKEIDSGADFG